MRPTPAREFGQPLPQASVRPSCSDRDHAFGVAHAHDVAAFDPIFLVVCIGQYCFGRDVGSKRVGGDSALVRPPPHPPRSWMSEQLGQVGSSARSIAPRLRIRTRRHVIEQRAGRLAARLARGDRHLQRLRRHAPVENRPPGPACRGPAACRIGCVGLCRCYSARAPTSGQGLVQRSASAVKLGDELRRP